MRLPQLVLALVLPSLLLAGCGGGDTPSPVAPSPTAPPATAVPATTTEEKAATPVGTPAGPPGPTATWPADAVPAIAKAQQAVAQQAKVAPTAVTVVSVTEHSWPT